MLKSHLMACLSHSLIGCWRCFLRVNPPRAGRGWRAAQRRLLQHLSGWPLFCARFLDLPSPNASKEARGLKPQKHIISQFRGPQVRDQGVQGQAASEASRAVRATLLAPGGPLSPSPDILSRRLAQGSPSLEDSSHHGLGTHVTLGGPHLH